MVDMSTQARGDVDDLDLSNLQESVQSMTTMDCPI